MWRPSHLPHHHCLVTHQGGEESTHEKTKG